MKGGNRQAPPAFADEQFPYAFLHFARGFVREGNRGYVRGGIAAFLD